MKKEKQSSTINSIILSLVITVLLVILFVLVDVFIKPPNIFSELKIFSSLLKFFVALLFITSFFKMLEVLFSDENFKIKVNSFWQKVKFKIDKKSKSKDLKSQKETDVKEIDSKNNIKAFSESSVELTYKKEETKGVDDKAKEESSLMQGDKTFVVSDEDESDNSTATNILEVQDEHSTVTSMLKVQDDGKIVQENKVINYLYLFSIFVLVLTTSILFFSQTISFPKEVSNVKVQISHLIITLLFSLLTFVARKLIQVYSKEGHSLFISLLFVVELNLILTLIFIMLDYIFKINYIFILSWIYSLSYIYSLCAFVFSFSKNLIKKHLRPSFSYELIPVRDEKLINIIEENTGWNLKSVWSLKYVLSKIPALVTALVLVLFVATSFYVVKPQQEAVIYRLGVMHGQSKKPGLHMKLPNPFDKVEIYDVERVQSMQIGYVSSGGSSNIWTQEHDGGEHLLTLGDGRELVAVNINLMYKISDLEAYLSNYSDAEEMLSSKAYELMMHNTINSNVDTVITKDRRVLSGKIKTDLNSFSSQQGLGLLVENVVIASIHPPVEVAEVYQSVISANVDKTTKITKARSKAETTIIEAEKEKEQAINTAKERQKNKVAVATSEMAVYYAAFEAYQTHPESFKLSKYLKTYEKVLKGNKVYVFSPNIDSDLSNFIMGNGENAVVLPKP